MMDVGSTRDIDLLLWANSAQFTLKYPDLARKADEITRSDDPGEMAILLAQLRRLRDTESPSPKPFLTTLDDLARHLMNLKDLASVLYDDDDRRKCGEIFLADLQDGVALLGMLKIGDCPLTKQQPENVGELKHLIDETLPWIQGRLVHDSNTTGEAESLQSSKVDQKVDRKKKTSKRVRPWTKECQDCARNYNRRRFKGEKIPLSQVISDYVNDHPEVSLSTIQATMSQHPEQ